MNSLLLLLSSILLPLIFSKNSYYYENFSESVNYNPIEINRSKYNGSGICVTVFDLIAFHYTERLEDIAPTGNVFPENFCYGMINYNITREDFRDIIKKNVNAFKNYRSLIPFYIFTNYTGKDLLDDGCIGYFKLMSCLNEFPTCEDNGDGTFKAHPIVILFALLLKGDAVIIIFLNFAKENQVQIIVHQLILIKVILLNLIILCLF